MDPRYGEISRAMRNRGVEIFMLGEVGFNIAAYIVSRTSEIIRTWWNAGLTLKKWWNVVEINVWVIGDEVQKSLL